MTTSQGPGNTGKPRKRPAPGGKRRRRPEVPTTAGGAAREDAPLGVPIRDALRGPAADVHKSTAEVGAIARELGLPAPPAGAPPPKSAPLQDLTVLSNLLALGLVERPEYGQRAQATPAALGLGATRKTALFRGRTVAVMGQNLAADGRLFLGAKFSFLFGVVMKLYQELLAGSADERALAATAFRKVDGIRIRLLDKLQTGQQAAHQKKATLATSLEEQKDDNAFQVARRLLDQGTTPDPETLLRAARHASKLQEELGLGLAPDRRTGPRQ